jgi:sigma-B regulation protein RsbU (phosphoserine phosphatase)
VTPSGRLVPRTLPTSIVRTLHSFERGFDVALQLSVPPVEVGAAAEILYQSADRDRLAEGPGCTQRVVPRHGGEVEVRVFSEDCQEAERIGKVLAPMLAQVFELSTEIQFFTYELSERFEEINLLYSISETLGSTLDLVDGARKILRDVRDVMGAKRGSLWVHDDHELHVVAEVGEDGLAGPIHPHDPDAITAMVFREGRSIIATRGVSSAQRAAGDEGDSFLSVPIR